jgi:hypothetical protein
MHIINLDIRRAPGDNVCVCVLGLISMQGGMRFQNAFNQRHGRPFNHLQQQREYKQAAPYNAGETKLNVCVHANR